jgi:hypothetical protein
MSNSTPAPVAATPWHVWLVGALAVLWNSVGAFDYVMTETRNAAYLSGFTPEQLAYFNSFPAWVVGTWALSVWGGVLGSVLLLMRRRWAAAVFGMSLATMLLTFFHNFVLTNGLAVMGGAGGLAFTAVIVAIGLGLLLYSRSLVRKEVLR